MKREIKFRGRRTDNQEWMYGYLVVDPAGKYRIYWKPFDGATSNTYHFVIPESVGQFTGLKDKNGVEIYEGDIVNGIYEMNEDGSAHKKQLLTIEFDNYSFIAYTKAHQIPNRLSEYFYFEVIGNIYEHPNLLKS